MYKSEKVWMRKKSLNLDNDVPIMHLLTDEKIWDMVLHPENNDYDTSNDDVDKSRATNISIDKCISLMDDLIIGSEKKVL